jgi:RNA polymerase sigma-70 factor, ECF subfamily
VLPPENRIRRLLVCIFTMAASAQVVARAGQEFDLPGSLEAEVRVLLANRPAIDRLYRLAGLLLGDSSDAEDATQEAIARAWRSAGSLRDVDHAQAWLDRILVNVCRDRLRRRRVVRFIALADGTAGGQSDPFQAVLDRDEALRAIATLDADQRIVVVLHYWGGLTLDEIAARTGWPSGTVRSRLHHALERMRDANPSAVRGKSDR